MFRFCTLNSGKQNKPTGKLQKGYVNGNKISFKMFGRSQTRVQRTFEISYIFHWFLYCGDQKTSNSGSTRFSHVKFGKEIRFHGAENE